MVQNFLTFDKISMFLSINLYVTLYLIDFTKNCDFSIFLQFLEKQQKLQKSQFLLGTLNLYLL